MATYFPPPFIALNWVLKCSNYLISIVLFIFVRPAFFVCVCLLLIMCLIICKPPCLSYRFGKYIRSKSKRNNMLSYPSKTLCSLFWLIFSVSPAHLPLCFVPLILLFIINLLVHIWFFTRHSQGGSCLQLSWGRGVEDLGYYRQEIIHHGLSVERNDPRFSWYLCLLRAHLLPCLLCAFWNPAHC